MPDLETTLTLLAAVGFGSLIPGFVSDRRRTRHEHDAWLREKRFEALVNLLDIEATLARDRDAVEERFAAAEDISKAWLALFLVTPDSLRTKLDQYGGDMMRMWSDNSLTPLQRMTYISAENNKLRSSFIETLGYGNAPKVKGRKFSWRIRPTLY